MARKSSGKEKRFRLNAPSGQAFSIVERDGDRGWQLEATVAGTRVREMLGRGSREEATRKALERIAAIEQEDPEVTSDIPTLIRLGAELIVHKEKLKQAEDYRSAIEGHMRNYILPHYGFDTYASRVKPAEHKRFKLILGGADLDLATCNRVLTTLRQMFKYAEECGYCEEHWFPKNFPVDPRQAIDRWQLLEPDQVAVLLAHATAVLRPLFGYIANTGLRIGTALVTERAWIDFKESVVHYPGRVMKGRRPHTVELSPIAAGFLQEAVDSAPEGGDPFPFTYWQVAGQWSAIRNEAGFPSLRIHDLRHAFVSNQLAAGTPIHVVQAMAAHRSLAVTALYAHHTDEARRAAANRVQIAVGDKRVPPAEEDDAEPVDTKSDTGADTKRAQPAPKTDTKRKKPRHHAALRVGHLGLEPRANGLCAVANKVEVKLMN